MFCRGLQNAEMPPLCACVCVCTQTQAGGKPQFFSLALEKAIKGLERGKPQSIITSLARYLRCFWHALAWHLSPFLSPGEPGRARLWQRAAAAPARRADPSVRWAGERGELRVRLTPHVAGNFCHLLLPFLPCLTKISLTK